MKDKCIVDSSVFVKGLLYKDESDLKKVEKLLRSFEVNSSELVIFEIGNAIGKFHRNNQFERDMLMNHFMGLKINLLRLDVQDIKLTNQICIELQHSFYDCSYHALAISRDIVFYTYDKKYYNKAKDLGCIKLME